MHCVKGGGYTFGMANDTNWRNERDDELFPICNEDRAGETYTDEYGQTYTCTLVDGLGWAWKNTTSEEPS